MPAGGGVFENTNPDPDNLREISDGWNRHLKHDPRESQQMVIQIVLSMNGQFDWEKFRGNHPGYCAHYDAHGWDYCRLSFLAWIRAGMPPAPPEARGKNVGGVLTDQKSTYKPLPVYLPAED